VTKLLLLAVAAALASTPSLASGGKGIFDSLRCGSCHKEDADGVGPSHKAIAAAYAGDKAGLVAFLAGKGEPRMDAARFALMKSSQRKTSALPGGEQEDLAEYLLGKE